MAAWGYEIPQSSRVEKYSSTLEEKFRISPLPFNILYTTIAFVE